MPRPNKEWERKYGKQQQEKKTLLSGADNILSASAKLGMGVPEAQKIILQMLRGLPPGEMVIRLLDMDDMQLHGAQIPKAYNEWAKNDYTKLLIGIRDRDESLIRFIRSQHVPDTNVS